MTTAPEPPPATPEPELTPTGRVILGMLAKGVRTGYDIKQFVDRSTRNFWAASYGQIYPELRRLEQLGLVASRSEPTGGRARTVYEPTPAGHAALTAWLESPEEPLYELRDEGMLKLFFSDLAPPPQRIAILRAMRERLERKLARLRAIDHPDMDEGPRLTLALGIRISEEYIAYCEATERLLAHGTEQEDQ
jgi:DNA-binding PadR family transcriptional regulator